MNSITICGNLGKDCETRYLANGDAVSSFSVADSQGKDKPSIWWSCALFGKRGESLEPYLTKGQTVTVVGTVSQREYTDKDGNKRTSMDVRVNDVALQGGKPAGTSPVRTADGTIANVRTSQAPRQAAPRPASGFDDMDDDIPFVSASMHYDMTTSKARKMACYDY